MFANNKYVINQLNNDLTNDILLFRSMPTDKNKYSIKYYKNEDYYMLHIENDTVILDDAHIVRTEFAWEFTSTTGKQFSINIHLCCILLNHYLSDMYFAEPKWTHLTVEEWKSCRVLLK